MIELKNDTLKFSFPQVHPEATLTINFQRTLRLPDDGKTYSLPPGLGEFPVRHVDDFADRTPPKWAEHGGVMLPMHQSEALWIGFDASGEYPSYPFAVKVAAGKINAVNGDPWVDKLSKRDYIVVPEQPWLDGFYSGPGTIRQFVAMPLGEGHTAEEQITGEGEFGGIQIAAWPLKRSEYKKLSSAQRINASPDVCSGSFSEAEMGMAPGGKMKQEIYEDEYGFDKWDRDHSSRCFVHILNSQTWKKVTKESPPTRPMTTKNYVDAGLPWFDYYDEKLAALTHPSKLTTLTSIGKSANEPADHIAVKKPTEVIQLSPKSDGPVRELEIKEGHGCW
jgi:hypothetical protein